MFIKAFSYTYQLIGSVFGTESQAWLARANPEYPFNGKPPCVLVECCREHRDRVLRYLENLSTDAAVRRTEASKPGTVVHDDNCEQRNQGHWFCGCGLE